MANHEGAGGNRVAERIRYWASEAGESAALSAGDFLIEFVGEGKPLSQESYAAILAAKREEAAAKYTADREAGLLNDKHSTSPGLTAVIRPHAEYFDILTLNEGPRELTAPLVETIGEVEDAPLYRMSLPEGLFEEDNMRIRFATTGAVDGRGIISSPDNSFNLNIFSVVRIEGDDGDLWQNTDYNPDGTPTQELLDK